MKKYQITKYNPRFRDEFGVYNKDEWTSIYDIGKIFDNEVFSKGKYLNTEDSYLKSVENIMRENGIRKLTIMNLVKNHSIEDIKKNWLDLGFKLSNKDKVLFETITEGYTLDLDESMCVLKLILREALECILYSLEKHFVIICSYDYYMHVTCDNLSDELKRLIESRCLFVE